MTAYETDEFSQVVIRPVVLELAAKLDLPKQEVAATYRNEMDDLARDARIHAFIPKVAVRRTREVLMDRLNNE